jgi:hypothetical protein
VGVKRQQGTQVKGSDPDQRSPGDVCLDGARGRSRRHSQPCGARVLRRPLSIEAIHRLRRLRVAPECGEGVLGGPTIVSLSSSGSPDRPLSVLHWTANPPRIAQSSATSRPAEQENRRGVRGQSVQASEEFTMTPVLRPREFAKKKSRANGITFPALLPSLSRFGSRHRKDYDRS